MFPDLKTSFFFADVLPADLYTKISTRSSVGIALKSSSVSSVPDSTKEDHSLYSTPVAYSIGRGKLCQSTESSASSKLS